MLWKSSCKDNAIAQATFATNRGKERGILSRRNSPSSSRTELPQSCKEDLEVVLLDYTTVSKRCRNLTKQSNVHFNTPKISRETTVL